MVGMKGISFILKNVYQVGILAIFIVFQPELRAALEKLGGNSIVNGIKNITMESKNLSEITEATTELVNAVCDLSKTKTGAIIVLENTTKLGEYIQSGKIVDAKIGADILKNIFYNKAPLHDGAVILRNYRVFSAGCFLPLSMQEDIDDNMGTRHRAALGISEVSDAIVVVVSEETGTISIVHDGVLVPNYSYKSLKKELTRLLLPNENQKSGKNSKNSKANKNKEASK